MVGQTLFTITVLILCLLPACGPEKPADKKTGKPNAVTFIEGVVAAPSNLTQSITVPGTLLPFDETVLMPEAAGRVTAINIPEGTAVKKGTLLVKLFDAELQASLGKARAQLQMAELTEKRQAELLKLNGISQADYDQGALQVNSFRADVEALQAQIRKTEVLAPYDGIVGLRNISVGAQVAPGTPLVTIRAVNRFRLDFSVPEKYSRLIKTRMPVKFTVQGDEKPFTASVSATEQGIETGTRTLKVRALVDGKNASLVPGAFVSATLLLSTAPNAILIPTQAIIPQERDKRVIVSRQGKAVMVTVKTGLRQAASIEVLSGLVPGDTVVTTGIQFIKPGMALTFSRIAK